MEEYNFLSVVPDSQKDNRYYKNWCLHILSQYNQQTYRSVNEYSDTYNIDGQINTSVYGQTNYNYITTVRRNKSYYENKQDNEQFGFIGRDLENNPTAIGTAWQRIPKISSLVNDMTGEGVSRYKYYDLFLKSISPSAENEKTQKHRLTSIKIENKERFQQLEELGIYFNPLGGAEDDFDTLDDVDAYLNNDYKTVFEVYADVIKDDTIRRNDISSFIGVTLKEAIIVGLLATKIETKDGKTVWHNYPQDQIIWDNSKDRVIHKDFKYIGLIDWLTASEIIDRYKDDILELENGQDILNKLERYNISGSFSGTFSGNTNFNFLYGQSYNGIPMLGVVSCYWQAIKKNDEEEYSTFYEALQIADLCTIKTGETTNLIENFDDRRKVCPPVVLFTYDMFDGMPHSFVSRMIHHADLIDFYKNKMNELIIKSHGNVPLIIAENIGKEMYEVINDVKQHGMSMITNANGLVDDFSKENLVSYLNFSNYQEIEMLASKIAEEERMMEKIISASDITLGQQTGYVSSNTQMTTIEQAKKSVLQFYDNYQTFIEHLVTLSVNIEKNLVAKYNDKYGLPFVSKFGNKFLEDVKDFGLEDFRAEFKYLDPITQENRAFIRDYLKMQSQDPNSGISPEDVVEALSMTSLTQLKKYFRKITRKNREREIQQEQAEVEQQLLMQDKDLNTQLAKENINAETEIAKQELKNRGDFTKQMITP